VSMATDVVDAQIEAYRAKDVERFLSHYADDVSVVLFDGTPMFANKAVMREQYGKLIADSPDLRLTIAGRMTACGISGPRRLWDRGRQGGPGECSVAGRADRRWRRCPVCGSAAGAYRVMCRSIGLSRGARSAGQRTPPPAGYIGPRALRRCGPARPARFAVR
jgi:hypothetical protein